MSRAPGFSGVFVIPWRQTEIDHEADGPLELVTPGAAWRWWGEAVRVDGPHGTLLLDGAAELRALHAQASRAARRLLGATLPDDALHALSLPRAALPEAPEGAGDATPGDTGGPGFVVTDGERAFAAGLAAGGRLAVFADGLPRPGTEHWVVRLLGTPAAARPRPVPGVICFTPGTLIETPSGARPVEALLPGDRVLTRDDGPQPVIWTGGCRLSPARLAAEPALRPVRLRRSALGAGRPAFDLVVSPAHRVLLRGRAAQALYNTPEVLVRAADLLDDRRILREPAHLGAHYIHLMLERHQILTANGVETESFHPAHATLEALPPGQHAALLRACPPLAAGAHAYGAPARRCLDTAEAAILRGDTAWPH